MPNPRLIDHSDLPCHQYPVSILLISLLSFWFQLLPPRLFPQPLKNCLKALTTVCQSSTESSSFLIGHFFITNSLICNYMRQKSTLCTLAANLHKFVHTSSTTIFILVDCTFSLIFGASVSWNLKDGACSEYLSSCTCRLKVLETTTWAIHLPVYDHPHLFVPVCIHIHMLQIYIRNTGHWRCDAAQKRIDSSRAFSSFLSFFFARI